jgi:hypothetical protein
LRGRKRAHFLVQKLGCEDWGLEVEFEDGEGETGGTSTPLWSMWELKHLLGAIPVTGFSQGLGGVGALRIYGFVSCMSNSSDLK